MPIPSAGWKSHDDEVATEWRCVSARVDDCGVSGALGGHQQPFDSCYGMRPVGRRQVDTSVLRRDQQLFPPHGPSLCHHVPAAPLRGGFQRGLLPILDLAGCCQSQNLSLHIIVITGNSVSLSKYVLKRSTNFCKWVALFRKLVQILFSSRTSKATCSAVAVRVLHYDRDLSWHSSTVTLKYPCGH